MPLSQSDIATLSNEFELDIFYDFLKGQRDDIIDELLKMTLGPHGYTFYSKLKPYFLFNIKEIETLNNFKSLLIRDGALTLNKFFLENPNPGPIKTILIINEELLSFIPLAWLNNILLFREVSYSQKFQSPKRKCFLSFLAHDTLNTRDLSSELHYIKERLKDLDISEIDCFFLDTKFRRYALDVEEHSNYLLHFSRDVIKTFSNFNVHFPNWASLKEKGDLGDYCFYDFNPSNYLYSLSFVTNLLSSSGALNLQEKKSKNCDSFTLPLSHFHGIQVHKEIPSSYYDRRETIEEEIPFLKEKVLKRDFKLSRDGEKIENAIFCTPEFESYTKELLKP